MYKKSLLFTCFCVFLIAALLTGCAGLMAKPTEKNFKNPVVTLNRVELQKYWGWWFYSSKIKPTKGKAGNNSAPLVLAFVFDIENPNKYPVLMENINFTVGFEEFDLDTVLAPYQQWIPPGKTNQICAYSIFDARSAQLSLLVTGGFKLKARGWSFWDALEKYWTKIPDFSFPVKASQGAATFSADGVTETVTFSLVYSD